LNDSSLSRIEAGILTTFPLPFLAMAWGITM